MNVLKTALVTLILLIGLSSSAFAQSQKASSGRIDAANESVTLYNVQGYATMSVDVRGTFSATLTAQCSIDGSNWGSANPLTPLGGGTTVQTFSAPGAWLKGDMAGCLHVRVTATDYTSGQADVWIRATVTPSPSAPTLSGEVTVGNLVADAVVDNAAISTGPQIVGFGSDAEPTGVSADGDAARMWVDQVGRVVSVVGGGPNTWVRDRGTNTDGSSTSVVAAQGSGVRLCVTTLIVSNSSATAVTVDIRDGTAGTILATVPAAANMGGAVIPLPVPICTSANTALAQDPSAAATTITVTAVGFKATF